MNTRGGKRAGAGRKALNNPTRTMRVPVGRVDEVKAYLARPPVRGWGDVDYAGRPGGLAGMALPLFDGNVPAGFPSPAEDYAEGRLDLNDYLVEHEAATFYVRVKGHSMSGAGILDGDIIAVDRALEAHDGDIVLAVVDGELTVKELSRKQDRVRLLPHNPDFPVIEFKPGQELLVWGVVKGVVRKLR